MPEDNKSGDEPLPGDGPSDHEIAAGRDSLTEIETSPPPASSPELEQQLEPFVQPGRIREAAQVVRAMLVAQSHSGPLPSAAEFHRYDQALPGAADRILSMAEREQIHRHGVETEVVSKDVLTKQRGQWFAFLSLFAMLSVVAFIAYLGHPTAAASLGGAVIVGVVALFLGQKWKPSGPGDE